MLYIKSIQEALIYEGEIRPAEILAPAAKALLEMMEFMAKHDNRYTLSEIVESLDITSNSAFRIFKEMEQKGYVVKDPVTSTYELTPKLYYLGSSIRDRVSFIKTAQPYMESIKKATRETVLLTRFTHQYDTLVVDQLESSEPIKFVSTVGLSYDSYASAMGKAMLSMLDEKNLVCISRPTSWCEKLNILLQTEIS